jgi:hypothetical protein
VQQFHSLPVGSLHDERELAMKAFNNAKHAALAILEPIDFKILKVSNIEILATTSTRRRSSRRRSRMSSTMAKTLRRIVSAVAKTMTIKRSYPPMTRTQADAARTSLPLRFLWSLRWGPTTRSSPLQLNNYELFCLQNYKTAHAWHKIHYKVIQNQSRYLIC